MTDTPPPNPFDFTYVAHRCPRRAEDHVPFSNYVDYDDWGRDNTCSYCGSLNPDVLMERAEIGDIEFGPTDKHYKVYVKNRGGAIFKHIYRDCPTIAVCKGPETCTHWVAEKRDETKFYFQHLSPDQQKRFIQLLNEHKLKIGMPGHFYVLPFFIGPKKEE